MKSPCCLLILLVSLLFANGPALAAKPREAEWHKVEEATKLDQPQTAIGLLKPIETAAFAEQAWAEGAKALAMRIVLGSNSAGSLSAAVKQLTAETASAPAKARPLLRLLQARWLFSFYQENRWQFESRSTGAAANDDDIESWDLVRLLAELDRRFQAALGDASALQTIPVAQFNGLLERAELGDEWRPTLYDFIAHDALEFYALEEIAGSSAQEAFAMDAASPALDPTAAFLAWHPQTADRSSPKFRALRLYQDLLTFHQADANPAAFFHCDLERIRWAGKAADGPARIARLDAALRAFSAAHAKHPISADARHDLALSLIEQLRNNDAHAIAKLGAEAFPKHPFGKACQDTCNDLEAPGLDLETPNHWSPAGEEIRIKHSNVSHVWFRAVRRTWTPGAATFENDPAPQTDAARAALLKLPAVLAWDAVLPDDHDFKIRSTSLPAPKELPPGFYLILGSPDKEFQTTNNSVACSSVHVTSVALVMRSDDGKLSGLVTDALTGAPLDGVPVKCWHPRSLLPGLAIDAAKSDANGWFALPVKANGDPCLVVAGRGDDLAVTRQSSAENPPESSWLKNRQHVVFFTDRSLYRPGQTIHFKGIRCEANQQTAAYHTLAGRSVTVVFRDPNKKEVRRQEFTTNELGSISGTFTAPAASVLGRCTIEAGDLGSAGFSIEEYKRPKFSAKILPPAAPARLGATVELCGLAETFAGSPVDGAKVSWHVTRSATLPGWIRYCSGGLSVSINDQEIAHGTTTTTASGSFDIAFTATPDADIVAQSEPLFTYQVSAEVTDPSGETRCAAYSVNVAYTTLKAGISTKPWLEESRPVEFTILTESHDGEGRPAQGVLKIHKLQEPAECSREMAHRRTYSIISSLADDSTIDPSDPDKWPLGAVVKDLPVQTRAEADKTGGKGEAKVSAALPAGCYRAVFVTQDANGRKVQALANFQVVNPAGDKFPTPIAFFTAATAQEVEPGEPFTLVWGSGHPTARACVEWFKDGRLLKREWSAAERTQQAFSFTPDESMRGGFALRVTQTTLNHLCVFSDTINVPWSNKKLALRWEHLSSKLAPGTQDTWTAIVTGPDAHAASAEMVATLYDASLDAYVGHEFADFSGIFRDDSSSLQEGSLASANAGFSEWFHWEERAHFELEHPYRRFIDAVGGNFDRNQAVGFSSNSSGVSVSGLPKRDASDFVNPFLGSGGSVGSARDFARAGNRSGTASVTRNSIDAILNNPKRTASPFGGSASYVDKQPEAASDTSRVAARKNLQETAFFYPNLTSDEKGEVRISFTMPEALTRWKFLGFAHDKDMRCGSLVGEALTAKDLMVQPNPPRFLREGDVLDFTVKISNQSEHEQSGSARLTLTDAATQKDASAALGLSAADRPWTIPAKESRTLSWHLTVPDGCGVLSYKALATSGTLSDGEEGWLPVISRRVRLTESMSLPIRDAGSKEFTFQKLVDSGTSTTLENRLVQVQVVSQPAWHAVLALPYLMEFPHQCAEQTFNRYYANALARHIAKSDPKIRRIFELWKNTPALDSPLTKDADLKGLLLEETPWLAEASEQSQARRKLGLLFDDNHLAQQLDASLKMLGEMQDRDGLWPWFPGGHANETISLTIATGFARLRALGVETDVKPALKALTELDARLSKRFAAIQHAAKKDPAILRANHLDAGTAHFLYARTFFLKDRAVKPGDKDAFDYFCAQARQFWPSLDGRMSRAHAALALARLGDNETALLITRSLRENALSSEEDGMSWHDAGAENWWWWQAPIETQAMMIEAFREIDHDAKAVEACQVWLIKQKQLREWHSTKATADAIHALLMGGGNLLGSDALLEVALGGTPLKPEAVEPGSGFYEARFAGASIKPELGHIRLTKTDPGVAWASISWQYLDDLAKVTGHQTSALKLEKTLFVRKHTAAGPKLVALGGPVKVGDELVTRLILRNARAMEFVHLKDLRGSGTEPVQVLSGYHWQDGLGYYEVTRDSASHFFIDALPAGTHVFETSVRAQHAGIYQTGVAEINCMYAPGFSAHSASVRLEVVP